MSQALSPAAKVRWITVILIVGAWSSGVAAISAEEAWEQLEAHLSACTEQFGYDPDQTQGIGPHELAPNEREWRDCVYQGVETIMIPNTQSPEIYQQVITEDRNMTEKIVSKQMTRTDRQERLDVLVASIKEHEEKVDPVGRMKLRTIQNVQRSLTRLHFH